jgi:hypothetical protein
MKTRLKKTVLAILLTVAIFVPFLFAQANSGSKANVHQRWMLEFANNLPNVFTYVTPSDKRENYWYMVYTITNPTDDKINLGVDICVRAIIDKENIDKEKPVKDTDKYYQDAIHPFIEDGIIIAEEKLAGLNQTLQADRIKELKRKLNYLNCKELRDKKEILPKETIKCLAVFNEFDPKSVRFEVMVGGLFDVIKWRFDSDPPPNPTGNSASEKIVYGYECKIRKVIYDCPGDEFWDQTRALEEVRKEWLIRDYGPFGDKKGLESMMESLSDPNPLLRWTGWYLLHNLTGLDFKYNPVKTIEDNKASLERWREWWHRNKENLFYNSAINRFEVRTPMK